ncbi:hypothetical protein ACQKLX_15595 [Bosea sp. NPDC003192]|jgi:hypothetical protein|uniref:hypothetical protein n=1 Tax=Bosea sp. NPDC003192 TaxID=3390551 RepID=UPI003D04ACF7
MAWRKLGQLFVPNSTHPALVSHSALPVPAHLSGDLFRIFYSGRDSSNRSSVGSVVARISEQPRIEESSPEPLLLPGSLGAFDDAGVGVGSIVRGQSEDRLYYMGWNIGGSVPWRNAIGVAVGSASEGRFERLSAGPVMDRDPVDHFSLSYPCVLNNGPDQWEMWYGTHIEWGAEKADMSHAIRRAISADGITWKRSPQIVVDVEPGEVAVVRPSVHRTGDGYRMWFARRGHGAYDIAYAVSRDGINWLRKDAKFPMPEAEGWEGGAATYPAVFDHGGRLWLLYNGAGYGKTGFGLAVWEA